MKFRPLGAAVLAGSGMVLAVLPAASASALDLPVVAPPDVHLPVFGQPGPAQPAPVQPAAGQSLLGPSESTQPAVGQLLPDEPILDKPILDKPILTDDKPYPPTNCSGLIGPGSVSKSVVLAGESVVFSGCGFIPGRPVNIKINGQLINTVLADATGSFAVPVNFPTAGQQNLTGSDVDPRIVNASVTVIGFGENGIEGLPFNPAWVSNFIGGFLDKDGRHHDWNDDDPHGGGGGGGADEGCFGGINKDGKDGKDVNKDVNNVKDGGKDGLKEAQAAGLDGDKTTGDKTNEDKFTGDKATEDKAAENKDGDWLSQIGDWFSDKNKDGDKGKDKDENWDKDKDKGGGGQGGPNCVVAGVGVGVLGAGGAGGAGGVGGAGATPAGSTLPFTGVQTGAMASIAVALLGGGALLRVAARRRRTAVTSTGTATRTEA
ncbi:hypothetical protein [Frankia sp. R82]|uniref:hypothetical protein n=1 Tax=Frankia sp. R82 TaxID=2950553 RepID=UPI002043050C|nr:hypothetical protein [Frankia sp. R82]MCM3887065.1 hypothetical protein [Frankia sp. R82]